jgi:phospholipid/cholesterol/gamma-HCH transport system substrate-binding protein
MASRVRWSELRIGLLSVAGVIVAVLSILLFARVGALHGDTNSLYVTVDHAPGVLKGTDVWLLGRKVGLVKNITFRPVTVDTLQRVAIETEIMADYFHLIRKNSIGDIRAGGNLIGSPVVYIDGGTTAAPAVKSGDTIASVSGAGKLGAFGPQIDSLAARLNRVADSTGRLIVLMGDRSTSIGQFRSTGMASLRTASSVSSDIMTRATSGSGTLGLAKRNAIGDDIRRVLAQKDSIMFLVSSGSGNVGRFRRDSTLMREVARTRAEVDSLRLLFSRPGAVSRLRTDTALKREIGQARIQLDSLMLDLKKHPLKYISF